MSTFVYPALQVTVSGGATEAKQDTMITSLSNIDTDTTTIASDTTSIDSKITACNTGAVVISAALPAGTNSIGTVVIASATPVDFLDSGVVDSSSTNIPAAGLTVVASLAANVTEIEIIEDIGEYFTITDGSDTILAYAPLGGGRVKLSIASGTALKLASVSGATITTGKVAINFLG